MRATNKLKMRTKITIMDYYFKKKSFTKTDFVPT